MSEKKRIELQRRNMKPVTEFERPDSRKANTRRRRKLCRAARITTDITADDASCKRHQCVQSTVGLDLH